MFPFSKRKINTPLFAFCESIYATGTSPWHIRKLTSKGIKLGGGADTESLCGRKMAWDLDVKITQHHLDHCCNKCSKAYLLKLGEKQ